MKFKTLSLAIFSVFALAACGGGGSSSSNNSNDDSTTPTTSFQQWSIFEFDSYSDELSYDSETATIDNGKFYTAESMDDSFMVTANGLYDQGPLHSTYGYLNGNISISNNVWTLSPYSSINSSGLKIATTMKQLNIEGENMAAKVDAYNYWLLKNNPSDNSNDISDNAKKYLTAISNVKFPAGAKCLQLNKVTNSEQYLELDNSASDNFQEFLASWWNELSTDTTAKKYIMKDTIAYTVVYDDESEYGVAQYKNRFYDAYPAPKGTEFDLQNEIKFLDTWANTTANTTQKAQILEFKQLVENSCHMYNDVAFKAIEQSISTYK